MNALKIYGIVAFATVLASCATTSDVPDIGQMLRETTGQNGRACVWVDDIRGYGVLKDDVVSIDSMNDYYLATVLPGCIDLQTSVRALFSGDFGEICGRTMDSVVTRGDRCTINQMFEFESREEAFATFNQVRERREELKRVASD